MSLESRLAKLEARYGGEASIDLAALVRQGADHATIRAAVDRRFQAGLMRADDFALLRTHPAYAQERAAVRAETRQGYSDRGDPVPEHLRDGTDPGRPL